MNRLEYFLQIAVLAHAGQVDKGGAPYILHPLRVMAKVKGEAQKIVAVLHDVVEDCPDWTLERLEGEGLMPHELEALAALTKQPREEKFDYYQRVSKNPIAINVKLADLEDNLDVTRLGELTKKDFERIVEYKSAKNWLEYKSAKNWLELET